LPAKIQAVGSREGQIHDHQLRPVKADLFETRFRIAGQQWCKVPAFQQGTHVFA
jgi:hypothetical protein